MVMKQVSDTCFAVLNEKNLVCDANSGLTSLEAATRIEFGPYSEWRAPARLFMNVERAYREFRNEPPDAPWHQATTFDAICQVAKAKEIEPEF